jgi:hypothetical protein
VISNGGKSSTTICYHYCLSLNRRVLLFDRYSLLVFHQLLFLQTRRVWSETKAGSKRSFQDLVDNTRAIEPRHCLSSPRITDQVSSLFLSFFLCRLRFTSISYELYMSHVFLPNRFAFVALSLHFMIHIDCCHC